MMMLLMFVYTSWWMLWDVTYYNNNNIWIMILRRKIESIETLANDVLLLIMMCLENAIDGTNIKMNEWGWMMQFRFLISVTFVPSSLWCWPAYYVRGREIWGEVSKEDVGWRTYLLVHCELWTCIHPEYISLLMVS